MTAICNETIQAAYFEIKESIKSSVVDGFQLGIVVCSLGFIELLGMALNFLSLVVLCQDRKNKGAALLVLQVMTALDNFYLACNFAGTWLPAFLQYVTYGAKDCPLSDYTSFRLQEDLYFRTVLNSSRDAVNWMMFVIAEYSSFPLFCPSKAAKRLHNIPLAVMDLSIMSVLVLAFNIFKFVCGPAPFPWSPLQCYLPSDEIYWSIDKSSILLPEICVGIIYVLLIIQMYVSKGTSTDPRGTRLLTQINRAFAITSLYLVCEVPNFVQHLLRWDMLDVEYGPVIEYVISYIALLAKHVNSSCKFFVYCYIGTDFKGILKRLICEDYEDEQCEQQEMEPVLNCGSRDRLENNFEDVSQKRHLLTEEREEPCTVAHQVTVV